MSYDLMVFDPAAAPRVKEEFLRWYDEQTGWEEDLNYQEESRLAPALHQWLKDMKMNFPIIWEINPDTLTDAALESRATDYTFSSASIYMAFAWSQADEAYQTVFRLAAHHRIGFFDISGDSSVYFPDGNHGLVRAFTAD